MHPAGHGARLAALAAAWLASGCDHPDVDTGAVLDQEQRAAIVTQVRAYAGAVAADVTREGPAAWRRHFSAAPEFFMAADGALVFADGASAASGIDALTTTLKRIRLTWGDDLRIDVLTPDLALIGSSFAETLTDAQGRVTEERGFFSGLAERREGAWRLRSAHWSSLRPPP